MAEIIRAVSAPVWLTRRKHDTGHYQPSRCAHSKSSWLIDSQGQEALALKEREIAELKVQAKALNSKVHRLALQKKHLQVSQVDYQGSRMVAGAAAVLRGQFLTLASAACQHPNDLAVALPARMPPG